MRYGKCECRSLRPYISRAAIAEALTTLLHYSSYEPGLSLQNLTLVDEYLAARSLPPMENARAYALSNILTDLINQHYRRYRGYSRIGSGQHHDCHISQLHKHQRRCVCKFLTSIFVIGWDWKLRNIT
jgi:hypothetical protein